MISNTDVPRAKEDLLHFKNMLQANKPFTFVRFSDGEIEILRNRYLKIGDGEIAFQGATYRNIYPVYDSKTFDPELHGKIRLDLLAAAQYRSDSYYIGIPTSHNSATTDRDWMVELNGGHNCRITFSDIFINSNYKQFKYEILPLFERPNFHIICNYRACFSGVIRGASKISIGDNFFLNYEETFSDIYSQLINLKPHALVLSSASSLSNILGYKLNQSRTDITFIDVGTALNYLMGLKANTRLYHGVESFMNWREIYHYFRFRVSKNYRIKW